MGELVSRDEGPATCDWSSSSWTMSSEMWARIWFLWAIAGRRIMTWAFVIRRPEHGLKMLTNDKGRKNTLSKEPFKPALADLSYPRRKRSQQKGNGNSKTWRRRISHSGFDDYCHQSKRLVCFLNHSENHRRMQQALQIYEPKYLHTNAFRYELTMHIWS